MIEVRHRDGPRHDPGRPRGRAGQIELNFNFDRAECTADNLSTFPSGREAGSAASSDVFPVLHAEAVHGRVGERMPPQHLLWRDDENAFMPDTDDLQKPSQTAVRDRRDPRAPRRADRSSRRRR
jgi:hypothetical protein